MAVKKTSRAQFENLTRQEEKILALLREERSKTQQKFPLAYSLIATFGLVCVFSGFYKFIEKVDFLRDNPSALVIGGLAILVITGAAYKKLG